MGLYGEASLLLAAATVTICVVPLLPVATAGSCQPKCGSVEIPYPFGIGPNCSLPGFSIECFSNDTVGPIPLILNSSPGRVSYQLTSIDVSVAQARITTTASPVCGTNYTHNVGLDLRNTPFVISDQRNKFIAVGCNTVALLRNRSSNLYTLWCVSICSGAGAGDLTGLVRDRQCAGSGCCQTSIPIGLQSYGTEFWPISDISATNASSQQYCGYAFLVENDRYTFAKADLDSSGPRSFPVVVTWSIGNQTCQKASSSPSYACKDRNSNCTDSATGVGYICKCNKGYTGNPYVKDGCQDIDECEDPTICQFGICENTPGSHTCKPTQKSKAIIGVAVGISSGLGILLFLGVCTLVYRRSRKKKLKKKKQRHFQHNYDLLLQQQLLSYNGNENIADKIKFFSLKELEKATNNFDSSRVVGRGGHGTVYKGLLDLRVVAIKISKVTTQVEIEQFMNEIILLSQINHRNVVKLIGCCLETEVPLLVYEFISNGTLSDHLHVWNRDSPLSWDNRLRIAIEISRPLAYLHSAANVSIFHRDIKSSNILLDEKLTVKVSDFGASKSITFDQTHVSTNIQGTFGYLDPEYMHTGQLTEKSDVYGLGVILVELLTGEKPASKARAQDEGNLISQFVWALKENRLFQVVESSIMKEAHKEIEVVAQLAMACLSLRGEQRPTMKEVEMTLEGLRRDKEKSRKLRKQPDFFNHEEDETVMYDTSAICRSGSTTMTGSTSTQVSMEVIPSQTFTR